MCVCCVFVCGGGGREGDLKDCKNHFGLDFVDSFKALCACVCVCVCVKLVWINIVLEANVNFVVEANCFTLSILL